MNHTLVRGGLLVAATLWSMAAYALPGTPNASQADLCRGAINAAASAQAGRVPEKLMHAISLVESGRRDPATGAWGPWPWTTNAEGVGRFYETKAEAIQAVQALQARGVRSIDVGCMQVNLMHHANAFASLDEAFDPQTNARYGARFLMDLRDRMGSWDNAAAGYHSATPELGIPYAIRVLAIYMPGYQPKFPGFNAMMLQGMQAGLALPPAPPPPTPQQQMASAWGSMSDKAADGKDQNNWSRAMMQAVGAAQPVAPVRLATVRLATGRPSRDRVALR